MKQFRNFIAVILLTVSSLAFAGEVNINTASAQEIAAALDGVGEARAAAIVEYREAHGAFKTIEALKEVKGVGDSILEKNRDNIKLSD